MRVRQIPNNREAIYLIQVGYLYKVGRTENFQARIAGGKGGYQIEGKGRLVGWYEIKLRDGERCEKVMHDFLKESKEEGEWFKILENSFHAAFMYARSKYDYGISPREAWKPLDLPLLIKDGRIKLLLNGI